jgi:uncharacterized protein (TIGR03083 family)
MELTPRYDGPDLLRLEVPVGDVSVPLVRLLRRLGETAAELDVAEWSVASRCEGWSVRDVVAHLVGVNQYWALSMSSALAGSPTRFLATSFDPVATPAALVERTRGWGPEEVLRQYMESVESLAVVIDGLSDEQWTLPAEAPPGHLELRAVALHALWDAWTHERDIGIPLGRDQAVEADELRGSLLYAGALSPMFLATLPTPRHGTLAVEADDIDFSCVVEAGTTVVVRERTPDDVVDAELAGSTVDLIEGLTFRAPLEHSVPTEHEWLLGGLAQAFDVAP